MTRRWSAAAVVAVTVVVGGLLTAGLGQAPEGDGGERRTDRAAPRTPSPAVATADDERPDVEVTASREVTHPTLWLCGPAADDDACVGDLDATVIGPDGSRTLEPFSRADAPGVDCFYLYPTVSRSEGPNAPLAITDAERGVARVQAGRFGEVCRVVAPIYRQVTVPGLLAGAFRDQEARDLAFGDVLSAWNDHVATSGDRPFVLVGHSQGAHELTRLLAERIEGDPELRPRLLVALLLGGEVTVPVGAEVGGSFRTVPACREEGQVGCVVAYNSFADTPPRFALFGRAGDGLEVLCVHPGALDGGPAPLSPYLPTDTGAGFDTPFVTAPGAVTGECRTDGDASWLQVDVDPTSEFAAAAASADLGPAWGLHHGDVNLGLGDLVELVRSRIEPAS